MGLCCAHKTSVKSALRVLCGGIASCRRSRASIQSARKQEGSRQAQSGSRASFCSPAGVLCFFDTINRREISEGLLQVAAWSIGTAGLLCVLCEQNDGEGQSGPFQWQKSHVREVRVQSVDCSLGRNGSQNHQSGVFFQAATKAVCTERFRGPRDGNCATGDRICTCVAELCEQSAWCGLHLHTQAP